MQPKYVRVGWVLALLIVMCLPKSASCQQYFSAPLLPSDLGADFAVRARADVSPPTEEMARPRYPGFRFTSSVRAAPEYILPGPANPNMMFDREPEARFGVGGARMGLPFGVSTTAKVRIDAIYDTGHVGGGAKLFPSTIALDGTDAARRRGRTLITPNSTQVDLAVTPPNRSYRGDVQLDFDDDTVRVRHLKGQVATAATGGFLYGGSSWTTFMDEHALPKSLCQDTTSAGTVFRRQAQMGYTHLFNHGWSSSIAIENGADNDFALLTPATDERLHRYPDLITRLHWASSNDVYTNSTFHVAALVRGIGFEDVAFNERFATGWGVSTMGKIRVIGYDTMFAGFVGGEGIGSYIYGFQPAAADVMPAAGPNAGAFVPLTNYGAHIGYSRVWCPGKSITNVGYGYAYAESTDDMLATSARRLQNAWINHEWRLTSVLAVGVEYHYAIREVRDGTEGDNQRFMLTVQIN